MIEFKNPQKIALPVIISLLASTIIIIMIIISFFLGLLSSDSSPLMPGILGGTSFIPVFGLSFAFYLLRSPVRILITDDGLTVEWLITQKSFDWNTISRLEIKEPGIIQNWLASVRGKSKKTPEVLAIFDHNNKKLVEIDGNIENFSLLMEQIRQRSSDASGKETFNTQEQIRKTLDSQGKKRILMLVLGIIFAAVSITMLVVSLNNAYNKKMLENDGEIIQAKIKKHYIYNVTPRLEFTFTTEEGETFSKDVMVSKTYWQTLEENGIVPVKYLPANPKINSLAFDNANDTDMPLIIAVPACLIVCFMGCTCLVMYFLKITDLKFENGRFKVVRVGDVESKLLSEIIDPEPEILDEDDILDLPEIIPDEPVLLSEPQKEKVQIRTMPKGLKAIGILNIIFGSLGFLWSGVRILIAILLINNPDLLAFNNIALPDEMSWVFVQHLTAAILALLLAVSGIGILLWKNWARILAVIVVIAQLAIGFKEVMIVLFTIQSGTEGLDPEQAFIAKVTMAFCTFLLILSMLYPAVVLILLQRKSTREVFKKVQRSCDYQAEFFK